jgi:serine protease Do
MMRFFPRSQIQVLALCVLPFAFCFRTFTQWAASAPATWKDEAEKAVVQLLAVGPGAGEKKEECAATGFVVNEEGYILTNAHVVDDARRCLASSPAAKIVAKYGAAASPSAEAVSCDVVAVDEEHDLAILKPERPTASQPLHTFLRLDPQPVSIGTPVAVTGHPAFIWQPQTRQGKVTGRERLALDDAQAQPSKVIVINLPLQRGASGSPVYLESGAVVGIVERRHPAQLSSTVAVPAGYAIRLLDLQGVRWHAAR